MSLIHQAAFRRNLAGEPGGVSPRTTDEQLVRGLTPSGSPDMRAENPSVSDKDSNNTDRDVPAEEFRRRWQHGERPQVEDFLQQFPDIRRQPEVVLDVIYEEYLQRQAAGDVDVEQDLWRRFPQWREPLQLMIDCHRLLQSSDPVPDFPEIGDWLGEFRLLAELGQGARGRVCLAAQTDLADRLVVLKLTPLNGIEHLSLARLQHTNIVPVYSVADDPQRRLRILVMPYFGRATLATMLTSLAEVPLANRRGANFVAALDQIHDPLLPAPVATPARQMLAHVSYTQAVCWIAASLADALQYAHDRALVHLDIKPSNVLLAHDGQPMLLDFHLACEPVRRDGQLPDRFGGTPEYMPPEQRQAMSALCDGTPIETDVDARADIFSLGAIIYELLGGRLPLEASSPPLARINPRVSLGLSDIVAKCSSPNPALRYASAADVAEDLRRYLADESLAHTPNRSLSERWYKWRRRQPNSLRFAGMAVVVGAAVCFAAGSAWWQLQQRATEAELTLRDGRRQLQLGQTGEAVRTFERGMTLISAVPFRHELSRQLRDQLEIARRLRLIADLHVLADRTRMMSGNDPLPHGLRQTLADLCQTFWNQRRLLVSRLVTYPGDMVAADLLDVAIFWARLQRQLAPDPGSGRELALTTLAEAEELFGPSSALECEQAICRGETPQSGLASTRRSGTHRTADRAARPPRWEHYALGRALLHAGRVEEAAEELDAARHLDPAGLWPNFYFGLCAHRLARYEDSVAAFSVCIGANPQLAGCFYNRALSLAALGRVQHAQLDFERAKHLDPSFAATIDNFHSHNERSTMETPANQVVESASSSTAPLPGEP